ncbi:MAG: glutaredoxin family protein [Chloroflexi bacterium]|nr:glutaredoxin family protein [Chloroflexota bacterium]
MTTEAPTLVIYTHPECIYSNAQKEELDADGVPYREVDISVHPEAVEELKKLTGGDLTTPVMVEGSVVTVGFKGMG